MSLIGNTSLNHIFTLLKSELDLKADKNQGIENAGKYWMVGSDGDLTFGIPATSGGSSGVDGTYYVTPEMYGAKGDGATDDTNAFLQAIQSEKPIICKPYVTYYFKNPIILPNLTNINIQGNNCTLKTLH